MRLYTPFYDAKEAAGDVKAIVGGDAPILAFVAAYQWDRMEGREATETLNDTENGDLERFRDKAVVFCHYEPHERHLPRDLAMYWHKALGGRFCELVVKDDAVTIPWLEARLQRVTQGEFNQKALKRHLKEAMPVAISDGVELYDARTLKEAFWQKAKSAKSESVARLCRNAYGVLLEATL